MNTIRQRVYVGVMLAALAVAVALMMMAMANQPEPYELSSTEVAGLPVLGSSSSPACAGDEGVDRGVDCMVAGDPAGADVATRVGTRIGDAKDFDMNRAAGLMRRAKPVLEVPAEPAGDQALEATGDADSQGTDRDAASPDENSKPTTTARPSTTTSITQPPTTSESTRPARAEDDDEGKSDDDSDEEDDDDDDGEHSDRTKPQPALQQAGGSVTGRTPDPGSDTGRTGSTLDPDAASKFEQAVIDLTNKHRVGAGCEPLKATEALAGASRAHSRDMAENDYFDHTGQDGSNPGDRAMRNGYTSMFVAENIAWGYRTPEAVVEGWMGSRGHRGNMLDCRYTHIGVGFHDYYWTQTFGVPN